MKKRELLITFLLAISVTGLSCLLIPVRCLEVCTGWPLVIYESFVGWDGHKTLLFYWPNLALDFLFWFLVLASGWWLVKKMKQKRSGFSLIGVLLIIGVLAITAGGVVWERKVAPTPTPTPTTTNGQIQKAADRCEVDSDCEYIWFTGGCHTPEYVKAVQDRAKEVGMLLGEAPRREGVICKCQNNICVERVCAINGESPTDFDLTTGKFRPKGKSCCEGLKAIDPKRESCLDDLNKGVRRETTGSSGICRPCGDGLCNSECEDRCNCPEDC